MKRAASAKSVSEVTRKAQCPSEETASPNLLSSLHISNDHLAEENGFPSLVVPEKMVAAVSEKVVILDFGAQYGKVIDRRVRECNVLSEMLPMSTTAKEILDKGFKAIIISGGPKSVYAPDAPIYDPEIFTLGLPIFGICYGFQHFGGTVRAGERREDQQAIVNVESSCPLFHALEPVQEVLLTHGDVVTPDSVAGGDFQIVATAEDIVIGIANDKLKIYGTQFHPEVDLTDHGEEIFQNFLRIICKFSGTYTVQNRELMCIEYIKKTVGDKNVLVMVSGGVDSTVCAALLVRALGPERVIAIHIDNGFMRYKESDGVIESLNKLGLNVKRFNCIDQFLDGRIGIQNLETQPLRFVVDPEEKRMIIGDTFIRCKEEIVTELKLDTDMFLAQGTLRPDLIESASALASGCADTIKTHHNDTALVRKLRDLGKVVEPLTDFHKDEVRELGRQLGLPHLIVNRHPFPGPGLAIRILCAQRPFITDAWERVIDNVNNVVAAETHSIGATVLPIRSVGVQGDRRTYSYPVVLSSNQSPIQWALMDKLAKRIPAIEHAVNRVCYAFGGAITTPVRNITITHLSEGVIHKLRRVDHIVTQCLNALDSAGNLMPNFPVTVNKIQQMPVILIPVQFGDAPADSITMPGGSAIHSVVLRPFITKDFMTGRNALPERDLPEAVIELIVRRIMKEVPLISRVLIDLTSKPPGTTEWE